MALDIHAHLRGEATTDKLTLNSLLQAASSTFHQTKIAIPSGKSTADILSVLIADSVIDEEEEEREWNAIVSKPHVRQALRRMAAEARRQIAAGEIEEGGFAIE